MRWSLACHPRLTPGNSAALRRSRLVRVSFLPFFRSGGSSARIDELSALDLPPDVIEAIRCPRGARKV
jgi:hypothetical protein